jgi:hypothetical protein
MNKYFYHSFRRSFSNGNNYVLMLHCFIFPKTKKSRSQTGIFNVKIMRSLDSVYAI